MANENPEYQIEDGPKLKYCKLMNIVKIFENRILFISLLKTGICSSFLLISITSDDICLLFIRVKIMSSK